MTYKTLKNTAEGFYKEKGSKFFAFAYPADSEESVKHYLELLQKTHPKARHVCYAWITGKAGENQRANDDGEPSGTAGLPVLNQIKSAGLTNTVVAVVRYFGGVKLGTAGLRNAYKTAAANALSKAGIIEKAETRCIEVTYNYEDTGMVMQIVNTHKLKILHQAYHNNAPALTLELPEKDYDTVMGLFQPYNVRLREV